MMSRNDLQKCLSMVLESGVCPETSKEDWVRILLYANSHNYLYSNADDSCFALAYKIPRLDERYFSTMPENEYGNILYVSWVVSNSPDKTSLLKLLRTKHDVDEIAYFRRNNNSDFRTYKLRRCYV